MVGRVNGALLWPDALVYLSGSLAVALGASNQLEAYHNRIVPRPDTASLTERPGLSKRAR